MYYIKTDTFEFLILLLKRGFAYFDALSQYPSLCRVSRRGAGACVGRGEAGRHQAEHSGCRQPPKGQITICEGGYVQDALLYCTCHAVMLWWYVVWIRMRSTVSSCCVIERCRDPELDQWAHGLSKEKRDGKKKTRLPETPKTPEEMWQQSIIGGLFG